MNTEALDLSILGPAFLAGLLVLSTHVPLGREVLKRGIVFLDLAVAQIAALGVIIANTLGWGAHGVAVQVTAAVSAVAGALALRWTDRHWPEVQEALIGTAFILAATGGLILLAHNPHGAEHMKDLLSGQILWVSLDRLIPVAIVYALILVVWFRRAIGDGHLKFYLLFSLSVTASVQLVGVFLVFASLIIPALTVRGFSRRAALLRGYALGALGYGAGLILSALLDLPSGPVIVWILALLAVVFSRAAATVKAHAGNDR